MRGSALECVERRRWIVVHVHAVVCLQRGVGHDRSVAFIFRFGRLNILRVLDGPRLVAIQEYEPKDDQQGDNYCGADCHARAQLRALLALDGRQLTARLLAAPSALLGALSQVLPDALVVGYAVILGGAAV